MKKINIQLNEINKIKEFIQIVHTFESDINIYSGSRQFDAKSSMCIYSLGTRLPIYIEMVSDNEIEIEKFEKSMEYFK